MAALENATDQCQTRADHLASLLPEYREKYLFPSQKHAEDLELRAAQLTKYAARNQSTDVPLYMR